MANNRRHIHRASRWWQEGLTALCLLALVLMTFTGCRRDLYVFADNDKQIELITDWSLTAQKPGGMTWWFIRNDHSGYNRHETTAQVSHSWVGIAKGQYTGFVFDYSPAEYTHLGFVDMTEPETALMLLKASVDQPAVEDDLFGAEGVPATMTDIALSGTDNGMYLVSAVPENINIDTLKNVDIKTGSDGDYVPYEDRDSYQGSTTTQTLYARPQLGVWKLRVVVHVNGINRLYGIRGSIAGLADGCWLESMRPTSSRCLHSLDSWKVTVVDSVGYVTAEQNCMGLPDADMPASPLYARGGVQQPPTGDDAVYDKLLRLNLRFLMRDRQTIVDYHYDLDDAEVKVIDEERIIVVTISGRHPNYPNLPFVNSDGSAGFDASVSEWEYGGRSDTTF